MARIRHIALVVKDLEQTADFYQQAFGLARSELSEGPTARRIYLSDGEVCIALLQYKSEVGSGIDPNSFIGLHHFGFQCDDLAEQQAAVEGAGGKFFFDLNEEGDDDFERKFKDPNGVIIDINTQGWPMTSTRRPAIKSKKTEPA